MSVKSLGGAVPLPTMRRRFMAALQPMDNGPQEIRALDGLRAVAALSIVIFHTLLFIQFEYTPLSIAVNHAWYYLSTGVDLFFVLSGFLLFLPYVRALLDSSPLPSARRFYRRRALRILPAYWACLAILVALKFLVRRVAFSPGDVAAHIVLVNDSFPQFNRDYNGPFWTLAVEAQFYVLLPLMALLVARVCGRRRSPLRITGGILVLIALAVVLRVIDTLVLASLPAGKSLTASPGGIFVLATFGMQGKYLEVFAVGMLCALLYVLSVERKMLLTRQIRRLGFAALAVTVLCMALAIPRVDLAGMMIVPGIQWGAQEIAYPLLVGLGFGGMVLAILWGGSWIRFPFEFAPMRTIGLISYSLYLWHLPIIHGDVPLFARLPLFVVLAGVFLVAYLSYQFVERPFLKRRHRETSSAVAPALAPVGGLESTAEEPDEVSA